MNKREPPEIIQREWRHSPYKLVITASADAKMDEAFAYILEKSQSIEIAEGVYRDYLETCETLKFDAGTIHEHPNKRLWEMGLRRKNFHRHDYFILFRMELKNNTILLL